ncbi:MAG TPA: hypothetical protein VJ983_04460 [candidate division Zixibacteria bacterium]|nr:hypothetical protein [candidate division Zixibacteria bacterium]
MFGHKHWNWHLKLLATGILTALSFIGTANAQYVANGLATADVMASLSVIPVQDLQFGNVLQGVAKAVANDDAANAGIFTITGQAGAGINIHIALPEYMATASGDDRMAIAFGVADCSIDSTANADPSAFGSGWQNINPYNLPNNLTVGTVGQPQTAIFLGGRVIPSIDQTAGAYTGDIIVTVAYNGT